MLRVFQKDLSDPERFIITLELVPGRESFGQSVDTLKGIIRVNNLALADDAVLRDEPRRFIVGAEDAEDAERIRSEIEALRTSGELHEIIERMDLD